MYVSVFSQSCMHVCALRLCTLSNLAEFVCVCVYSVLLGVSDSPLQLFHLELRAHQL